MPTKFDRSPDTTVKLITAASYLTYGIVGLIYIIANGREKDAIFFRIHFMQAILVGAFSTLFAWTGSILASTLGGILGLFGPAARGAEAGTMMIIGLLVQGIQLVSLLVIIAGVVQCIRGKYLELPFVSKLVRSNLR
jgi:uncharacterized membrane protein